MPMFTPSRLAAIVVAASLCSLMWTLLGGSRALPLPQPARLVPGHGQLQPTRSLEEWERPGKLPLTPQTRPPATSTARSSPSRVPDPAAGSASPDATATATTVTVPAPQPTGGNATTATVHAPSPSPAFFGHCRDVPNAAHVMVVYKTSRAELRDKLPAHIKTLLDCAPKSLIFSDHAGDIDGHPVHDALDTIADATKAKHKEFRDYESPTDLSSVNKDLDKWKMLPMVYKAYKMDPEARFYMFIEADTSLSWTNMLQWIDRLDYRINYYAGAPGTINNIKFAIRGAGILISQGAMRLYAKKYDELYARKWEPRLGDECCGDLVLSTVMDESHAEYYSANPMLQGEGPTTLEWTEKKWCAPVVSWHQVPAANISTIWDRQIAWTKEKGWSTPYQFHHAFADMILPHLSDSKNEWDNLSENTKIAAPTEADPEHQSNKEWNEHSEDIRNAAASAQGCRKVCEMAEDCVQWKYSSQGKGVCLLNKDIRLGHVAKPKDGEPAWESGWMVDRIKGLTGGWLCNEVKWRFNQS